MDGNGLVALTRPNTYQRWGRSRPHEEAEDEKQKQVHQLLDKDRIYFLGCPDFQWKQREASGHTLGVVTPSQVGDALEAVTVHAWHSGCVKRSDLWVTIPALEQQMTPESKLHHTPLAQLFYFVNAGGKGVDKFQTEESGLGKECVL